MGGGEIEVRSVRQLSLIVLLIVVIPVPAEEQSLESGYFKWLLHLGQNPSDCFTNTYPPDLDRMALLTSQSRFQPYPGLVFDYRGGQHEHPATFPILV